MQRLSCKTCATTDAVICLDCGHPFCSLHRGDLDGVPTCTGCLKEVKARKQRAAERAQQQQARAEEAAARRVGTPGEAAGSDATKPLAPLPEPAGSGPLLWGVKAALPTAIYFWFFLGWLAKTQELAAWVQPAGTAVFSAVAFVGVWAIAKTRAGSTPGGS